MYSTNQGSYVHRTDSKSSLAYTPTGPRITVILPLVNFGLLLSASFVDMCKNKLKKLAVNIGDDSSEFQIHFPPVASSVEKLLASTRSLSSS